MSSISFSTYNGQGVPCTHNTWRYADLGYKLVGVCLSPLRQGVPLRQAQGRLCTHKKLLLHWSSEWSLLACSCAYTSSG